MAKIYIHMNHESFETLHVTQYQKINLVKDHTWLGDQDQAGAGALAVTAVGLRTGLYRREGRLPI